MSRWVVECSCGEKSPVQRNKDGAKVWAYDHGREEHGTDAQIVVPV